MSIEYRPIPFDPLTVKLWLRHPWHSCTNPACPTAAVHRHLGHTWCAGVWVLPPAGRIS